LSSDYPVNTGFGLQIVKWTDLVADLLRTSITFAVSVNSWALRPFVLSVTLKLAFLGLPGNLFDAIFFPRNRTVALRKPAIARTEIGNVSVVPVF
jgi:hypothetical protein